MRKKALQKARKYEEGGGGRSVVDWIVVSCRVSCGHQSLEGGVESAANDESAHFGGARPYLVQLGVPQQSARGVVVDVPVAPQTLHNTATATGLFTIR